MAKKDPYAPTPADKFTFGIRRVRDTTAIILRSIPSVTVMAIKVTPEGADESCLPPSVDSLSLNA